MKASEYPQIKFIKSVEILSSIFKIQWDKTHDGGSFSQSESVINIGIKSYELDPTYTISILSHEIMELILVRMGARFENSRQEALYLFNFDHQVFENAIQLHTQALVKFIK